MQLNFKARKIFSVPLNPKLNQQQFIEFYQFCERNKDWISDIYFTSRIAPFKQDAMGDVFVLEEHHTDIIQNALDIQQHLGIPISATFNNTTVPPTQTNLDTFIINFKKLYDAGIRTATIPHTHWMATGQIKSAFPELFVKNTILREVRTAVEIVNLAKYGFDYINLDRDLMRDRDTLLRLKEAKVWIKENLGKDIQYSLLANEGCLGACSMMVEHFEYNNIRTKEDPQYFNNPISRVSCPKWEIEDLAVPLKSANFSPWREDWIEYLDLGIDVFKMHGREDLARLKETMVWIDRFVAGEEFVPAGFERWSEESGLAGKPITLWREKIKNCKFDCWECQYCDKIYDKKSELYQSDLVNHVVDAVARSGIPTVHNKIPGLTSPRVQTLLNLIAQGVGSYLEIGSYLGATASAVLKDNPINAYFVDNWKDQIQPKNKNIQLPANSKEEFEKNIQPFVGSSNVTVIDSNLFDVNTASLANTVQMLFYDGPHDPDSTFQAITYYYSTLTEEAIIIMDDANWDGVVDATLAALDHCGATIAYKKLMINSEENSREWWNGLYILVIRK
jgi:predicted O-methyltransferase YrrM